MTKKPHKQQKPEKTGKKVGPAKSEKKPLPKKYDHLIIEKKWQKVWAKQPNLYKATDSSQGSAPKKKQAKGNLYLLVEFPFPSGAGLHVGHVRSYTALDIIARKNRMEGKNVLYPIGWDAFGLPTENYAIKTGVHPSISTKKNTDNFERQLRAMAFSFDWSRKVDTTDPGYYKWTQWIFLQFLKKGLAYRDKISINWCPKDKIGLANEEVIAGCCERCGTKVEKREKEQWMLAITKYADRLDKDLDTVDYPERVKIQQRNWIGKSEGAELDFIIATKAQQDRPLTTIDQKITVFTTRPDTLFGVTYLVLAPEHKLVQSLKAEIKNWSAVESFIKKIADIDDAERTAADKSKTGVQLEGISAIHPLTGEKIPVWIADYVLATYGTGAVMAVPAHDERDFIFSKKYNLPIKEVVIPRRVDETNPHVPGKKIVMRKGILGIVINPRTKKFLALKWAKQNWTTFISGGIEEGEDPADAARREIIEETGYSKLKLVRVLGGQIQSEFFAAHKDLNRVAHMSVVVFELTDDSAPAVVASEETALHQCVWLDMDKMNRQNLNHSEMDIIHARMNSPESAYLDSGVLINSGEFSGQSSDIAKVLIVQAAKGRSVTKYRLRDWVFSRQRYWGEPIPVVHCGRCGIVPLPEKSLPLLLPKVKKYEPTDNGESPLAAISSWVNTTCPTCKGPAKRETDTMPNWAGSSWYYLRYTDPKNKKAFADPAKLKYWTPVDWYNGGMEHTTLHLLYSRFWHKFLFDQKLVPTAEPYAKRTSHGLIMADDGTKMAKSKGNVINPDDIIRLYGADTLRLFEMFIGPFEQMVAWNPEGLIGPRRFIERVYKLHEKVASVKGAHAPEVSGAGFSAEARSLLHKTIKKVSEDIESLAMNTAVSSLMILTNQLEKESSIPKKDFEMYLALIAPFIPHTAEELNHLIGNTKTVHSLLWPKFDPTAIMEELVNMAIQINGKVRGIIQVSVEESRDEILIKKKAFSMPEIRRRLEEMKLPVDKYQEGQFKADKIIFVPSKVINLVYFV